MQTLNRTYSTKLTWTLRLHRAQDIKVSSVKTDNLDTLTKARKKVAEIAIESDKFVKAKEKIIEAVTDGIKHFETSLRT